MSSARGWLINHVNPGLVASNDFQVADGVVRIFAANLGAPLPVQVYVGPFGQGAWVPLSRLGVPVVLTDSNNSYVELIAGQYRVVDTGLGGSAQVWYEQDYAGDGDNKTIYVFGNTGGANAGGGSASAPIVPVLTTTAVNALALGKVQNITATVTGSPVTLPATSVVNYAYGVSVGFSVTGLACTGAGDVGVYTPQTLTYGGHTYQRIALNVSALDTITGIGITSFTSALVEPQVVTLPVSTSISIEANAVYSFIS